MKKSLLFVIRIEVWKRKARLKGAISKPKRRGFLKRKLVNFTFPQENIAKQSHKGSQYALGGP
jgi:hypothetical protein